MITDAVLRSAMASKLAYAKSTQNVATFPINKQLLVEPGHFDMIDCDKSGAHAYIWHTGRSSTLVAFRGSVSVGDVCKYIAGKQVYFSFCDRRVRLHKCTYDMFQSIEPAITNLLYNRRGKQSVTFCGHSLGGALAMFASAYYAHLMNGNYNITCHTFGAPKTGDRMFVDWLDSYVQDQVHVCNKWDIVSKYPFDVRYVPLSHKVCMKYTTHSFFGDHDLDTYISNLRDHMQSSRLTSTI